MPGDKKWIVKSSDTLMGPYEFDTVVENIFSGDVHLLDEIKGPFERWRPIKDHSLFAAAIEKLKANTYTVRENTQTATLDIGTELTRSQTVPLDDNTHTPTVMVDSDTPTDGGTRLSTVPVREAPQPMVQPHHRGKRFPFAFVFSFLFIVLGGAGYLVYEFKQSRLIEQKISAYDQLTDNAIINLKTGEYLEALQNFKMAEGINSKDPNLIIEMSPLLVQFDGQYSKVQDNLDRLLVSTRQKTLLKMGHSIVGLTQSYRKQYEEALRSYDAALAVDEGFLPAQVNKAFALIKQSRPAEAAELMKRVVADHPDDSVAHYMYIRSLVEKGITENDRAALNEALSVSAQFSQRFSDFKQEVLFLIAVAHSQLEVGPSILLQKVQSFLRVDLALTNLHVHDTLIDFQSFDWSDFMTYCNQLQGSLDGFHAQLLQGFCMLKTGRSQEAKQVFEALVTDHSNDGLLQALKTSALFSLDQVSEAKNSLGFINQVNQKQPLVETILRGCLSASDLSCGEAIYRGRHGKHLSLLYSHWGNSTVMFKTKKRKAKQSVVKGLRLSPNFGPLLKIDRRF